MKIGQETELEDPKEGKVKGLIAAESLNWQEIWIKRSKDQSEVRSKRFGHKAKMRARGLGEQKVRDRAGWSWETETYGQRSKQIVWSWGLAGGLETDDPQGLRAGEDKPGCG